jgi:ABC-2 type transport system permease protein
MSQARAIAFQSAAAVRGAFAQRASFWLLAGGMIANNGFWLLMWFLFFTGFRQVGGWGLSDFARLIGVVYLLFGISSVFFGGYRDLAGAILRGDIDPLLTQPGPVLGRLLARESLSSAWGDIVAGVVVLTFSARLDLAVLPLIAAAVSMGMVVWLSVAVIFSSLAFWIAGSRSLARDLMDFTLMVAMYPSSIYSGWTRIVIFTLLPGGFIAVAPVALVRHPSLQAFALAAGGAVAFPTLAAVVFGAGLRRYRRGQAPGG